LRVILGRPARRGFHPSLSSLTQRAYVRGVTMPITSATSWSSSRPIASSRARSAGLGVRSGTHAPATRQAARRPRRQRVPRPLPTSAWPPPLPAAITSAVVVVLPHAPRPRDVDYSILGFCVAGNMTSLPGKCGDSLLQKNRACSSDMTKEHHDQTNPIRQPHSTNPCAPETHRRAAHPRKTNKKKMRNEPNLPPWRFRKRGSPHKNEPEQTEYPEHTYRFASPRDLRAFGANGTLPWADGRDSGRERRVRLEAETLFQV
jgi:hypothetical protein